MSPYGLLQMFIRGTVMGQSEFISLYLRSQIRLTGIVVGVTSWEVFNGYERFSLFGD